MNCPKNQHLKIIVILMGHLYTVTNLCQNISKVNMFDNVVPKCFRNHDACRLRSIGVNVQKAPVKRQTHSQNLTIKQKCF